jgi:hypothetical protein
MAYCQNIKDYVTRGERHIVIMAIIGVILLEVAAILKGMNGQAFTTAIGSLAGIAGYVIGRKRK